MSYFLGVDLGQRSDYTAIAIIEKIPPVGGDGQTGNEDLFDLQYLDRLPLGTPYPEVVRRVKDLLQTPPTAGDVYCVVDATGGGIPVVDMFREAKVFPLVAVTITGGHTVSQDGRNYSVPKRDLVSLLQVRLQNDRLRIAEGLPLAKILVREMQNFRMKINIATGHDSYEAWREGDHDDLVLAVALALWYAVELRPVWHMI